MNSRLIILSTMLATTAGFGVSSNALASPPDAQSHTSVQMSDHPAVIVARTWAMRGIDPNTFAVAHPARLQLLAASPSEEPAKAVTALTDAARSGR